MCKSPIVAEVWTCQNSWSIGCSFWSTFPPGRHPDLLPRGRAAKPLIIQVATSEMFPFHSQSATFSPTGRAGLIKWGGWNNTSKLLGLHLIHCPRRSAETTSNRESFYSADGSLYSRDALRLGSGQSRGYRRVGTYFRFNERSSAKESEQNYSHNDETKYRMQAVLGER